MDANYYPSTATIIKLNPETIHPSIEPSQAKTINTKPIQQIMCCIPIDNR